MQGTSVGGVNTGRVGMVTSLPLGTHVQGRSEKLEHIVAGCSVEEIPLALLAWPGKQCLRQQGLWGSLSSTLLFYE